MNTQQLNLFGASAPVAVIEPPAPRPDDRRTWRRKMVSPVKGRLHHAAYLPNSPRLQRVMAVLADGQWHTSLDIQNGAMVLNPSGVISELKHPKNKNVLGGIIEVDDNDERYGRYRFIMGAE